MSSDEDECLSKSSSEIVIISDDETKARPPFVKTEADIDVFGAKEPFDSATLLNILLCDPHELECKQKPSAIRKDFMCTLNSEKIPMSSCLADDNGAYTNAGTSSKYFHVEFTCMGNINYYSFYKTSKNVIMPFEVTVGERVLDMEDLNQHEITDEEDNCLELRNLSPSLDNIEVILTNKYPQLQGFGLDIKGGKDRPYISDDPGIFVSALKHAGLAEKSGNINVGDKIVEVNGKPVVSVTHAEAVELFLLDRSKVTLFLQKNAAQLIRAASLTPTPTSATGSITPDSDRSISPRRNGRAPEYETNLSISGFAIGLALGCVTVVLLRRYLNATPTKT